MTTGMLLVHGFSGAVADLQPLAARLAADFGAESVRSVELLGHAPAEKLSGCDRERLVAALVDELEELRQRVAVLVVVGHSTGGSLLLAALEQSRVCPDLLVLAATPFRVDLAYLQRWQRHPQQRETLSLTTVAELVRLINAAGGADFQPACPVLLLQGGADELVPESEAAAWRDKFAATSELVTFAESGHQLFLGGAGEAVVRQLSERIEQEIFAKRLLAAEPEAADFLGQGSERVRELMRSPSGRRLLPRQEELPETVPWGPAFANIEITTACNLGCRHCARTELQPVAESMSPELFETLLAETPSAYRVTLVGLGEPLLHPELVDFVRLAKGRKRRVGLVTNAQLLDAERAVALLEAGLDSIAFSLDTVDPQLVEELRSGSDLARIEANIRAFCKLARSCSRPVSTAVFSAVSAASLAGLDHLLEWIATLGVHVVMLSDLNFFANRAASLNAGVDAEMERQIRQAIARSFARQLPVLGVRHLEDFGLAQHYREALLLPPRQLYRRSDRHRHCVSPWQTLSVNVRGELCVCDCQPDRPAGSLAEEGLAALWNGPLLREQRRRMLGGEPPADCLACPRF